jgi:type VI secretion system secreted protein Hcp
MGHMEDIAFTYETIIDTWTPDGIEAQDSWNAPKT